MEKNQSNKMHSLGQRLIEARQRQGFATAKEFYQHIEGLFELQNKNMPFTYTTYVAYENGNRQPRLDILVILARALETSVDVLLDFYNEDYLLYFLTTLGFTCLKARNFIYIETENKDYMAIKTDVLLRLIALADQDHKRYIRQRLQDYLASITRQISNAYLAEATDLIGKAMATLLDVDYEILRKGLPQCPPTLKLILNNDPITALAFYYYTGVHPIQNSTLANDIAGYFIDWYGYDFSPEELTDENFHHPLEDKYPDAWQQIWQYQPAHRIDYIDEYMAQRLQIDSTNFHDIKFTFLYTLGGYTPFSYLAEEDIPNPDSEDGDLLLINKFTQNEVPAKSNSLLNKNANPTTATPPVTTSEKTRPTPKADAE